MIHLGLGCAKNPRERCWNVFLCFYFLTGIFQIDVGCGEGRLLLKRSRLRATKASAACCKNLVSSASSSPHPGVLVVVGLGRGKHGAQDLHSRARFCPQIQ